MAPVVDSVVDDLKHKIASLESRIQELESRHGGGDGSSSSKQEGVRMILMGPPGAGKSLVVVGQDSGVGRGSC